MPIMVDVFEQLIDSDDFFKSALLSFVHLHHAIAAQDIDGYSCPDRLPTTGANQLAGTGRSGGVGRECPTTCGLVPASNAYAVVFVAVHHNIGDIVFQNVVYQGFAGCGVRPPVFFRAGDNQAVGFRCGLEESVMIYAVVATVPYIVLEVQQMATFMHERCNDFLNGPVQRSRSDV